MNAKTLILAAGSSSRLGKKKQILTFQGDTLLNRTIQLCEAAFANTVYVILGFDADNIAQTISSPSVNIIHHPDWAKGMGSSIAKGIQSLSDSSTGVFIFLTDQIRLSSLIIDSLKAKAQLFPDSIISCRYNENYGAPSYFPASHFPALRKLDGASGAKTYIKENISDVKWIEFLGGEVDVDYPEDLALLAD